MKHFTLSLPAFLLVGCSLLPMEHKQENSLKTSENLGSQNAVMVQRLVEGEKTPVVPNLTVSGASNKVDITVSPAPVYREKTVVDSDSRQKATSDSSWFSISSISLPWGVALCMTALGVTALTFAIRYAIRSARASSVAVDQAFRMGDDFAAEMIRQTRTKMNDAMASGNMAAATSYANALAEIESHRGKLKSKKSS